MDALQLELARLRRDANLKQSIDDVDLIIAQLEGARESIVAGMGRFLFFPDGESLSALKMLFVETVCYYMGLTDSTLDPNSASIILAKLQNPLKAGFDKVNEDLNKTHKGQTKYGKALDKVCIGQSIEAIYAELFRTSQSRPCPRNMMLSHLIHPSSTELLPCISCEKGNSPSLPHFCMKYKIIHHILRPHQELQIQQTQMREISHHLSHRNFKTSLQTCTTYYTN